MYDYGTTQVTQPFTYIAMDRTCQYQNKEADQEGTFFLQINVQTPKMQSKWGCVCPGEFFTTSWVQLQKQR